MSTRAKSRKNGWSAGATTRKCWSASWPAEADDAGDNFPTRRGRSRPDERPHPRGRSHADALAGFSPDRAAARDGTVLGLSRRGDLALRRPRTRLVLEQLLMRRTYGHALRCADSLD